MNDQPRVFVIVETGALELAIAQGEAERLDEVQFRARIRREADDVARVRRDFRVHQYDRNHRSRILLAPPPRGADTDAVLSA